MPAVAACTHLVAVCRVVANTHNAAPRTARRALRPGGHGGCRPRRASHGLQRRLRGLPRDGVLREHRHGVLPEGGSRVRAVPPARGGRGLHRHRALDLPRLGAVRPGARGRLHAVGLLPVGQARVLPEGPRGRAVPAEGHVRRPAVRRGDGRALALLVARPAAQGGLLRQLPGVLLHRLLRHAGLHVLRQGRAVCAVPPVVRQVGPDRGVLVREPRPPPGRHEAPRHRAALGVRAEEYAAPRGRSNSNTGPNTQPGRAQHQPGTGPTPALHGPSHAPP